MKRLTRRVRALALACLLSVVPQLAHAQAVGQGNLIPNSASPVVNAIFVGQTRAQTFTANGPGLLSRIDVQIYRQASTTQTLILDLRRTTSGGAPIESNAQALATLVLNPSDLVALPANPTMPPVYSWDVTASHIDVRAGDRVAIVARSSATTAANGYRWLTRTDSSLYPAGSAYLRTTGSFAAVAGDQGFEMEINQGITFVWSGVFYADSSPDFAMGDVIRGKYTFYANLPAEPPLGIGIDVLYEDNGTWEIAVPSRGYRVSGNHLTFQLANNNPTPSLHDRYTAWSEVTQFSTPLPSGRSHANTVIDLFDSPTTDLLASTALPLLPPNLALASFPTGGRIAFSNNDLVGFNLTSLSFDAPDSDGDSVDDISDNCPYVWNPEQYDFFPTDGIGDACEDSDYDGVSNEDETRYFGRDPFSSDTDQNGTPDGLDLFAPWCETVLECPDTDPAGGFCDSFGDSVALSGDTLVVGVPGLDQTAANAGGAYVYQRSGNSWFQSNTLTPSSAPDARVGTSSAISGDTIVLGSPANGSYILRQQGFLWPLEGVTSLGRSVSVSSDLAAGGNPLSSDSTLEGGSVSLARRSGSAWPPTPSIAPAALDFSHFGQSVAVLDTHSVVAGAPGGGIFEVDGRGEVVVLDDSSGPIDVLTGVAGTQPGDLFGSSVAGEGTLFATGAPASNRFATHSGDARFYDLATLELTPSGIAAAPNVSSNAALGTSIALRHRTAAIGAPGAGRAYVARPRFGGGDWPTAELVPRVEDSDGSGVPGFGASVAADGTTVAVGGAKRSVAGQLRGVVSVFDARLYTDPDCDSFTYGVDNCYWTYNPDQADGDQDGIGDVCDDDLDNDGRVNWQDNCVLTKNPLQQDIDEDGIGDACDPDSDGDGNDDVQDNCVSVSNPFQEDSDGDGTGDACEPCPLATDPDPDNDGVCDSLDNCPALANPAQLDQDGDFLGDGCDPDRDADGVPDAIDNCVATFNPSQLDSDVPPDHVGDACDVAAEDEDCNSDGPTECSEAFGNAQYEPRFRFLLDPTSVLSREAQSTATSKGVCTIVGFINASAVINFVANPGATGFACCAWEAECHDDQGVALACASTTPNPPQLPYARLDGIHAYGVEPMPIGTPTPVPTPTYADNDIFPDQCDNCKYVENESQTDTDRDGIGDACECGDLQRNGVTDSLDVQALRSALANGTAPPNPLNCNVVERAEDQPGASQHPAGCNVADLTVLRRALAGKEPAPEQKCPAATGTGF